MYMRNFLHSLAILAIPIFVSGCATIQREARTDSPDEAQVRTNRDLVVEFYQRVLIDGDIDAADRYLRTDYIQHNPNVPTGLKGFKEYFTNTAKRLEQMNAELHGDIEHVVAEGDRVVIFVSYRIEGTISFSFRAADLFRVQDGRIAEHWDVMQGATLRDHTILMQN